MYIYLYIYYKNILFKPCLCVLHILSMHMDSHPDHCLIINLLHLFRAYLTVPLWQADLGSKQLPVLKQKVLLGSCAFRFIQTCGTTQGEDREQWNFSGWSWVKFWFSLGAEIMEVSWLRLKFEAAGGMLLIFRSVHLAVAPIGAPPNEAQQRMSSSLSKGRHNNRKNTNNLGLLPKKKDEQGNNIFAIHI